MQRLVTKNLEEKLNLQLIKTIALMVGLILLGLGDLWKKEIPILPVLILGGVGAGLSIMGEQWQDWTVTVRFIPGLVVLFLAWLTRETIGYGDGWVLLILGCFLPLVDIVNLCMIAITIAGLVALFLILVLRKGRKAQMPFVPFLAVGYAMLILM
jgi:leader peptidase (prepilin peptidase)/N-methyltransferase